MLEILFAHSVQRQAFLCLVGCGFCLGAMMHLSGLMRRAGRFLGAAGDLACCLLLLFMLLRVLLHYGGGARVYGLLGLVIGALLYCAALSRGVEALARFAAKEMRRMKKHLRPKQELPQDVLK